MSVTFIAKNASQMVASSGAQSLMVPIFYIDGNFLTALGEGVYVDVKKTYFQASTVYTATRRTGEGELMVNTAYNNGGQILAAKYGEKNVYAFASAINTINFGYNGTTNTVGGYSRSGGVPSGTGEVFFGAIFVFNDVTLFAGSFVSISFANVDDTITIGPEATSCGYYVHYPYDGTQENFRIFLGGISSTQIDYYKNAAIAVLGDWKDDPYGNLTPQTLPAGGIPTVPGSDPYSTDDVDFNLLPEVSAVGTGFVSLWCPTEQQMLDLSTYMWNADPLTLEFWRKLIADPIQLIYGLNIIPVDLNEAGIVGSSPEKVVVGAISTGISMNYLTSQWVEVDCGTIDIDELMGAYLDYDPYTKMDVYLPYIGYRPLRVDDFMPGKMRIKYKIDLLTGSCVAQIKSTKLTAHDDTLDSIIYQFMGNCAAQIPVTASQYADAVRSAISMAAAIGTVALLAGAGGGAIAAGAGSTILPTGGGSLSVPQTALVAQNSRIGMADAVFGTQLSALDNPQISHGGGNTLTNVGGLHSAASAAENVMGIKPSVERSGAIGGAGGMLCTQKPYVIITRPRLAHPEEQSKYTGYPSFMTKQLSELSGFTQIQAIHLESIPCTSNELAEIETLLKSGVIF